MVKFKNRITKTVMYVEDSRIDEYIKAGHELIVDKPKIEPVKVDKPKIEPVKVEKPAVKKTKTTKKK